MFQLTTNFAISIVYSFTSKTITQEYQKKIRLVREGEEEEAQGCKQSIALKLVAIQWLSWKLQLRTKMVSFNVVEKMPIKDNHALKDNAKNTEDLATIIVHTAMSIPGFAEIMLKNA